MQHERHDMANKREDHRYDDERREQDRGCPTRQAEPQLPPLLSDGPELVRGGDC
jgi:hypothetical protein